MLEIKCSGSPYEIGFQHGLNAAHLVQGSIEFYQEYFQRKSKMQWTAAKEAAAKFLPFLQQTLPHLVEEMRGLADGANVEPLSILALNARTEISMGMVDDGCTSLAWHTDHFSVAGQNWDWETEQKARLVLLHIIPCGSGDGPRPKISQVTEAGIIGKIGINSAGVAVFLNAIRLNGVNFNALPVHLALRVALESLSRMKAVGRLRSLGLATSAHTLIADDTGATSLEYTADSVVQLEAVNGKIAHTNHFLAQHSQARPDALIFPDSLDRMKRVTTLLDQASKSASREMLASDAFAEVERILEDEEGYPTSINRKARDGCHGKESATLFSIVADLRVNTATVRLGRPTECEGIWHLRPSTL